MSDTLPPPYPHVLAFPLAVALMAERDFPFPVIGVVHVANRIEVLRPIDAGERLELTARAADPRDHQPGRASDIRATASLGHQAVSRGDATLVRNRKLTAPKIGHTPNHGVQLRRRLPSRTHHP